MCKKINEIEYDYAEVLNLLMALDNALAYAQNELDDFGHLSSLSKIICQKGEDVFNKISDLSCEAAALQSAKNSRQ